jgi:hypothetical protein
MWHQTDGYVASVDSLLVFRRRLKLVQFRHTYPGVDPSLYFTLPSRLKSLCIALGHVNLTRNKTKKILQLNKTEITCKTLRSQDQTLKNRKHSLAENEKNVVVVDTCI